MSSPQVENGHLKIANEVWDKLTMTFLTGSEFQIVLAVIRRTWGWKKKQDEISLSQFREMTGQPERTAANSLSSLLKKNLLKQVRGGGKGKPSTWSFNKDWETWILCQNQQSIANSAILNTVSNGSQTLQSLAENTARNGRVSDRNLLPGMEQLSPKAIFKERKENIGAKAPSEGPKAPVKKRDEAYEIFCSEFAEHRGIPYRGSKGDFVQLAALKKAFGTMVPPEWSEAIHNYFSSPQGKYTLADVCCRFDVFKRGSLDRYGKPAETPQSPQPDAKREFDHVEFREQNGKLVAFGVKNA